MKTLTCHNFIASVGQENVLICMFVGFKEKAGCGTLHVFGFNRHDHGTKRAFVCVFTSACVGDVGWGIETRF